MADRAVVGGRPRSVTIAVALLTVVAVGNLADAIGVAAGAAAYPDRVREELIAADVDPSAFVALKPVATALPYLVVTIMAIAAVVLLGIAASVRAGHAAGRIVAWVVIGLSLALGCCGLGQAGTPSLSGIAYVTAASRDANGTHRFAQRLPEAYPPVYRQFSAGFAVFAVLALILVAALLARSSASRYFRPANRPARTAALYYPRPAFEARSPGAYHRGPAVRGPASAPVAGTQRPTAEQNAQLSILVRQHRRGELTDEQLAAARRQLLGDL